MDGEFLTQRLVQHFNHVPYDQTPEQTLNKDSKKKGSIIGFSSEEKIWNR